MAPPRKKGAAKGKVRYGNSSGELREKGDEEKDHAFQDILVVEDRRLQKEHQKMNHIRSTQMFPDRETMKDALRANMHKPRYDVTDFYHTQGFCQFLARHPVFENVTLGVIAVNAVWLSIDLDYNSSELAHEAHPVFQFADNFFCLYFTGELAFRFGAFMDKSDCRKDGWFCFDAALVSLMIFETWVVTFILLVIGGSMESGVPLQLLRMLRLLRLTRMARLARLLRSCPELLILVKGMVAATRSVFFTMLLLLLLLYVFSILFRQLSAGSPLEEEWFPGMLSTANNLVVTGVFFDNAYELQMQFIEYEMQYLIPATYLFVLLATFTILNMLVGVLCEVIFNTAEKEHEELAVCYVWEALEAIVDDVMASPEHKDTIARAKKQEATGSRQSSADLFANKKDGILISKQDFVAILTHKDAAAALHSVHVDTMGMVGLIDTIFACEEGGRGKERFLSFSDLIEEMLNARATEELTVKHATEIKKFLLKRLEVKEKNANAHAFAIGVCAEKAFGLPAGSYAEEVTKAAAELRMSQEELQEREQTERARRASQAVVSPFQERISPKASGSASSSSSVLGGLQPLDLSPPRTTSIPPPSFVPLSASATRPPAGDYRGRPPYDLSDLEVVMQPAPVHDQMGPGSSWWQSEVQKEFACDGRAPRRDEYTELRLEAVDTGSPVKEEHYYNSAADQGALPFGRLLTSISPRDDTDFKPLNSPLREADIALYSELDLDGPTLGSPQTNPDVALSPNRLKRVVRRRKSSKSRPEVPMRTDARTLLDPDDLISGGDNDNVQAYLAASPDFLQGAGGQVVTEQIADLLNADSMPLRPDDDALAFETDGQLTTGSKKLRSKRKKNKLSVAIDIDVPVNGTADGFFFDDNSAV